MDAIIFDIDGTLADCEHRRHHIEGPKKDWDAFFDAMVDDPPIEDVCWLLSQLIQLKSLSNFHAYGNYDFKLFICSGRPETHREQTEVWLAKHVEDVLEAAEAVLMRPAGDRRADTVIKREMLDGIRGQGYNVRLVVDDRQRVVDMWREQGVTCLQAATSDWDTGKVKVKPGHLYMMVGPACAGKTKYAERMFYRGIIISSDYVRQTLCGDYRDQSRNAEVFQAVHEVARARITSGLDAVIDSTNLRNRDRRTIRELMPKDCEITYVVVDRPLEEKRRDAGWRAKVRIKDIPLIDKHHQTFQSNIKEILRGDGDPRVKVRDLRK